MLKKTLNYLIFSLMSSVISFLTTVYMARSISQEAMGVIGLYMAILYIFPQLVSFGSVGLVSINKVKLSTEDFIDFSKSYITFGFINFSIMFTISCLAIFFLKEYWQIFFALPVISFLMFIASFHQSELVQDGKSKYYGIYNLFNSVSMALLTVVFIAFFGLEWDGRLWAMLVAQCLVVFFMYKNTFKTLHFFKIDIDKSRFKEYMKFGLPLMFGLGAGWVLNQADNYIVLHFFTLKDVGVYSVAYSIGSIVNIINQAVTNAITPILYNALEKKEGHKIVKKMNFYYSLAIIFISLFIGLNAFWYMPIVFGGDYANSSAIVFFIALAFGFNGIYRTTGGVIAFYKQNSLQMKLVYASAIVNVVASMVLIPVFGIVSPAIGTLVAYILLAYLSYAYGWKIIKKEELIA
jgi:O-antigen/teichoic acid export membrane protein